MQRFGSKIHVAGRLLLASWVGIFLVGPAIVSAVPLMAGDILVTDPAGIISLNPVTGAHSVFSSVGASDIDAWGRDIFAIVGNTIVQIDPVTGTSTTISSGGFISNGVPPRVAVGPGGAVYTLGHIGGFGLFDGVIRINVKDGSQSVVAGGLDGGVNDLSVGPDGKIIVVSESGHWFNVDPITGDVQPRPGGGDHTRGVDIAADGQVEIQLRGNDGIVPVGRPLFTPPEDFGEEGIIDATWGLYDNLFFSTDLGVFHIDGPAPSPFTFFYSPISHDVHGRLTAFVPAPPTLLLVLMGLIGLGVFAITVSGSFVSPAPRRLDERRAGAPRPC